MKVKVLRAFVWRNGMIAQIGDVLDVTSGEAHTLDAQGDAAHVNKKDKAGPHTTQEERDAREEGDAELAKERKAEERKAGREEEERKAGREPDRAMTSHGVEPINVEHRDPKPKRSR